MDNLPIIRYFKSLMKHLHIPVLLLPPNTPVLPQLDLGLRSALGISAQAEKDWKLRFQNTVTDRVIYYITDEFSCHYITLLLSEGNTVLSVGPYLLEDMGGEQLHRFVAEHGLDTEWLPILEKHYQSVRCLESESMLFAAVQTLGEQLWGVNSFRSEQILRGIPESWKPLTAAPDPAILADILTGVQLLEQRYRGENALMEAVSRGREHQVQMMLARFSQGAMERRTDLLRDTKNYTIILNTLMRKAAEQGGVHPLYIDRISSDFARRIETTPSWEAFAVLWKEMAQSYCLLVKKHTMQHYSPLVQKVITRIDLDLTADLSLRATAEVLNVNASYLSTHFKRQTGKTLTDYVNQKRIEHAAYLLSSTNLSVSAVAQACGIQDDNYFTKLFKRYNGMTPNHFRQEPQRYV